MSKKDYPCLYGVPGQERYKVNPGYNGLAFEGFMFIATIPVTGDRQIARWVTWYTTMGQTDVEDTAQPDDLQPQVRTVVTETRTETREEFGPCGR